MAKKYRTTDLSYEELLEFRDFIVKLPEEAKKDFTDRLQLAMYADDDDLEKDEAEIIAKYDLNPKFAKLYLEWFVFDSYTRRYQSIPSDRAVLFCDEHDLLNGEICFGFREDSQFLPSGVSVFGLITRNCCLIDKTFLGKLKGAQMEDLKTVLQEALLRRRIFDITAEDVIFSEGLRLVSEGFSFVVQTQNGKGLQRISYCRHCDEALNEDGLCVSVHCMDVN